mmetsp:Transcript_11429/g.33688  ORF Transcript_11429/g.33688 Transcript_11429/m.33688 type:complete len:334 (-) Transcript_11429:762-1763(-)
MRGGAGSHGGFGRRNADVAASLRSGGRPPPKEKFPAIHTGRTIPRRRGERKQRTPRGGRGKRKRKRRPTTPSPPNPMGERRTRPNLVHVRDRRVRQFGRPSRIERGGSGRGHTGTVRGLVRISPPPLRPSRRPVRQRGAGGDAEELRRPPSGGDPLRRIVRGRRRRRHRARAAFPLGEGGRARRIAPPPPRPSQRIGRYQLSRGSASVRPGHDRVGQIPRRRAGRGPKGRGLVPLHEGRERIRGERSIETQYGRVQRGHTRVGQESREGGREEGGGVIGVHGAAIPRRGRRRQAGRRHLRRAHLGVGRVQREGCVPPCRASPVQARGSLRGGG